jgi:hypothetical protein
MGKELLLTEKELTYGYSPTNRLRFIGKLLCQLWTSIYEGEEDKWVVVKGQDKEVHNG